MKRYLLCCCASLLVAAASAGVGATSGGTDTTGFTHVRTVGGIAEHRLNANGLSVLLLEDHSAPVVTFMVTYRVGSRNEVTGTTGATHLLEHLMFKGSANFNAANGRGFDTLMDRVGGINNATTWLDRTNYYENLPSAHLELAAQLEADRMRGLLLREEDREPEMTVVRNEFERGENDPLSALDKEVTAAAFVAHPYHHPTIGWRSDIEKVSIEKLREFYDTFYWPNNATVTIIGDFKPDHALALIQRTFGAIPASPKPIPEVYTEEPPQTGPRRVVVKRPGEVGAVAIAYKSKAALHPDQPALTVLATLLSEGKTSRLYRALIDANLAITAEASQGFFRDDTLFSLTALVTPGVTHEQVERALLAEVERVKEAGVQPDEVSRAINTLLASIAYGRDGSFAIAGQLNECIAVGDWTYYVSGPEKLRAVTVADVNRVARAYLNGDQSTTGWFIPTPAATEPSGAGERPAAGSSRGPRYYREPGQAAPGRGAGAKSESLEPAATGPGAVRLAERVRRRAVAGLDVLTLPTAIRDVVTVRGSLAGGSVFNPPDNSAIADLVAGMLDKGTRQKDKFEVSALLEQAGAALSFSADTHVLNVSAKCLRKDAPMVLALLAEQLREPRFDPAEFAKLKTQLAGRYRRALEDPEFRAEGAFERAVFPEGHPNRPPADEAYLADLERATLAQVKAFHAETLGTAAFRIVLVGDVDDAAIDGALAQGFGAWQPGKPLPVAAPPTARPATQKVHVNMPGKTSVTLLIGQPSSLRYADSRYQPLAFGTAVLGSGFFSARLLDQIRNREGLTYGIGARLSGDTYAEGSWRIEGTFAPDLLAKGAASTQRELQRFYREGITADELAHFKVTLTGTYQVALSTTGGLAGALHRALQRGYGPEWLDEYPRRIQALQREEVNAAIRDLLDPETMVTVTAGTLP